MTLTDKQKDIIKTLNLGYERGHLLDWTNCLKFCRTRQPSKVSSSQFAL